MDIIKKNITAATLAFKSDDFSLMNIMGNRTMSDSLFTEDKNSAISGFFVKQVALVYLGLKPQLSETEFLEAKLIGEKYISDLSQVEKKISQAEKWASYHQFHLAMRKYPSTGINKQIAEVYGEEPESTSLVRQWLIRFLDTHKTILIDNRNNFFKGVMNDLQRFGVAVGYHEVDTVVYSCVLALDRYYEYFRVQHSTNSDSLNKEAVETQIFPFITRLAKLSASDPFNYDEANNFLWDLIKGWREYFIYYLELAPRVPSKQIELSKETKAKLSEVVGKALQKELKT